MLLEGEKLYAATETRNSEMYVHAFTLVFQRTDVSKIFNGKYDGQQKSFRNGDIAL
jgi:hypothetical protein